jgi:putative tryptophan/tyrosine transport system substrate-binding protein
MRRREFITLGVAAASSWPTVARAQSIRKLPTIGFMGATTPVAWSEWVGVFIRRLGELGWFEGRNVAIEYRWAGNDPERLKAMAAEFVELKVDVIFAPVTLAALAAKAATKTIPIVFALVGEPVAIGLVPNLARPQGNVTGTTNQSTDLGGKRLEILREAIPKLQNLGVLVHGRNPANLIEVERVRTAAQKLELKVTTLDVRQPNEIPQLADLCGKIDGLYVSSDAFVFNNMTRINAFVFASKMPTIHGSREYVALGGLMAYGPTNQDQFAQAAEYVSNILKGGKPADLPIEQPTRFYLTVNTNTAKAIGLSLSSSFLARADEVIE